MTRKSFTWAALCALLTVSSAAGAQVAGYPSQPVRMIATFPPGGSVDVVARILGPRLAESLGQPVVVENRSGAGGNIGTEQAARARPDGHTLLIHTIPLVANAFLYSRMPYDALTDFVPVSWLSSSPSLVVVHPSEPARSLGDLLQQIRAKPGALNYAASGTGTNPHIAGELFNLLAHTDMLVIQFKGGGPALLGMIGGEVGIGFPNISEVMPHVVSGKLRPLAITSLRRSSALPNVPTVAEAGVPGYEFITWHGILAPKGTPEAIVTLLNERLRTILRTPEITTRFGQIGLDVVASTPAEFAAHLKGETEKWGRVIKERRIRAD